MPNQQQIDLDWLHIALLHGCHMSKDPVRKLGAAVVTQDNRMCSLGYNGLPMGVPDDEAHWERPAKYLYVVHAELNAIINCPFDTKYCTLYSPLRPCFRCIGPIANARIRRIVWLKTEVPLRGDHEDIFREVATASGLSTFEYDLDSISREIMAAFGHQHDGYSRGEETDEPSL